MDNKTKVYMERMSVKGKEMFAITQWNGSHFFTLLHRAQLWAQYKRENGNNDPFST